MTTFAVGSRVRVIAGPQAGLDGTVVEFAHGVYTIGSWLTDTEFWALEANVIPLTEPPADKLEATLHRLAAAIRLCAQELAVVQRGASECGELESAKEIWTMRNRLLAIAEDVS